MRWPVGVAVLCALLLVRGAEAGAEWIIEAGAGVVYETNIPRGTPRS